MPISLTHLKVSFRTKPFQIARSCLPIFSPSLLFVAIRLASGGSFITHDLIYIAVLSIVGVGLIQICTPYVWLRERLRLAWLTSVTASLIVLEVIWAPSTPAASLTAGEDFERYWAYTSNRSGSLEIYYEGILIYLRLASSFESGLIGVLTLNSILYLLGVLLLLQLLKSRGLLRTGRHNVLLLLLAWPSMIVWNALPARESVSTSLALFVVAGGLLTKGATRNRCVLGILISSVSAIGLVSIRPPYALIAGVVLSISFIVNGLENYRERRKRKNWPQLVPVLVSALAIVVLSGQQVISAVGVLLLPEQVETASALYGNVVDSRPSLGQELIPDSRPSLGQELIPDSLVSASLVIPIRLLVNLIGPLSPDFLSALPEYGYGSLTFWKAFMTSAAALVAVALMPLALRGTIRCLKLGQFDIAAVLWVFVFGVTAGRLIIEPRYFLVAVPWFVAMVFLGSRGEKDSLRKPLVVWFCALAVPLIWWLWLRSGTS